MEDTSGKRSHLRDCWVNARHHWVVAMIIVIAALFSFWTEYAEPLVEVPQIKIAHKLPLPWAAVIALAGIAFIVIEGSYRMRMNLEEKNAQLQLRLTPAVTVSDVRITPTPTQGAGDCIYVQIPVECKYEAAVHNCQGHLNGVRRWNPEHAEWTRTRIDERLQLGWSLEEQPSIVLHPRVQRLLNVFWVLNNVSDLHLCTPVNKYPLRAHNVFNTKDVFRFDIVITADSGVSLPVCLEAKWGDNWYEPFLKIVPNAHARPIVCTPSLRTGLTAPGDQAAS